MGLVKFKTGTAAGFKGLADKDAETLYFLSDTHQIYKGANLFTKSYEVVSVAPSPETAKENTLYVVQAEKKMYQYDGSNVNVVFDANDILGDTVVDKGTNGVTSGAIYTFVMGEINKLTGGTTDAFVTSIEADGENIGSFIVSNGEKKTTVTLAGLAKTPSYDPETRKITMPSVGGEDVVINLGKDMVVKSGSYDPVAKNIILVLTDDSEVTIPAGDLVDVYTSGSVAGDAVKITVSENNEISASLVVDTNAGFSIGADGKLTIDLSKYALATELEAVDDRVSAIETAINDTESGLSKQIADNKAAIATNAQAIIDNLASAKSYTDTEIGKAKTALEGAYAAADTKVLGDAKTYTDGAINTALTWLTI